MIQIKTHLQPTDVEILDREAAMLGITRSELIRRRVTGCNSSGSGFTAADYHRLVADAAHFMRNAIDRRAVETLTAYVIRRLHPHLIQANTSHQSPS